MENEDFIENEDPYKWLIKARFKNQMLTCNLYSERKISDKWLYKIYNLLVGTTFALWRAAPLHVATLNDIKSGVTRGGQERNVDNINTKASVLLEILIADNAIGYPQEKLSNEWMFGFYFNNALYRLKDIRARIIDKYPNCNIDFHNIDQLKFKELAYNNPSAAWIILHKVSDEIFKFILVTKKDNSDE